MRKWLLAVAIAVPVACSGQSLTTVTAANVLVDNGSGTAVHPPASSSLCFLGVNNLGSPVTYTPSGGSPTSGAVCQTLTSGGALTGSLQIANAALASPPGLFWTITVVNGATTYLTIPTAAISGSVFNYDALVLPGNGTLLGIGAPHLACTLGAGFTSTTYPAGSNAASCNTAGLWQGYPPNSYCPAGQSYNLPQSGGIPFCIAPEISGIGVPSGSCTQNSFYFQQDAGGGNNIFPCINGTWGEGTGAASSPRSILSFATALDPIDTTGAVDSTAAVQLGLNWVCNSTVQRAIIFPAGTYLIDAGVSLTCATALEPTIEGEGKNSIIKAGSSLAGLPLLINSNSDLPSFFNLHFSATSGFAPSAAFESRVVAPSPMWAQNRGVMWNILIDSTFLVGVLNDHDASGCGFGGNNSCDGNNDQWQFINVENLASKWGYQCIGGNPLWERIIGGHIGSTETIHNAGCTWDMISPTLGGTAFTILHNTLDTNPLDFPYLGQSEMTDVHAQGARNIVLADPASGGYEVKGAFSIVNLDCNGCGAEPARTVNFTNSSANIGGTNTYALGQPVQFTTTGTLPTNFSTYTSYYVVSTGNPFTVAATPGGTAIVAGSAGSGTQTSLGVYLDWQSVSTATQLAGFSFTGINRVTTGNGGVMNFPDTSALVYIQGMTSSPNYVNYGKVLELHSNAWYAGTSLPTFNGPTGGSGDFVEIGDSKGGTMQPDTMGNFSLPANLSASTLSTTGNVGIGVAAQTTTALDVVPTSADGNGINVDLANVTITNGHALLLQNNSGGNHFYFDCTITTAGVVAACAVAEGVNFSGYSDQESTLQWKLDSTLGIGTFNATAPQTVYSAAGTALPTCNSGSQGQRRVVSDATSPTYLGTYTSGGAVTAPVFCNGTSWLTD